MADEPIHSEQETAGGTGAGAGASTGSSPEEEAPPASEAAQAAAAAKASSPNRTKHLVAGAAIGIGSAALVAALLYSRSRKSEKRED